MKFTGISKDKIDGAKQFREVDISDICFITMDEKIPVFHTLHGVYYQIVTLHSLQKILSSFGFEPLDKTNIVNLNKIVWIDESKRTVHFENGMFTSISKPNLVKMRKISKYIEIMKNVGVKEINKS